MPSNTVAIWILCVTFCVFLLLRFPVALVLVISSIATPRPAAAFRARRIGRSARRRAWFGSSSR